MFLLNASAGTEVHSQGTELSALEAKVDYSPEVHSQGTELRSIRRKLRTIYTVQGPVTILDKVRSDTKPKHKEKSPILEETKQ